MEKQVSSFTSPILVLNGVTHSSIFGQADPAEWLTSSDHSQTAHSPTVPGSRIDSDTDGSHEAVMSHT
jgi:hypothetical protein